MHLGERRGGGCAADDQTVSLSDPSEAYEGYSSEDDEHPDPDYKVREREEGGRSLSACLPGGGRGRGVVLSIIIIGRACCTLLAVLRVRAP